MRKAITLATLTRTLAMAARKIDPVYPGTAVARLEAVHQRLAAIPQSELDGPWPDARRALLRAVGVDTTQARWTSVTALVCLTLLFGDVEDVARSGECGFCAGLERGAG